MDSSKTTWRKATRKLEIRHYESLEKIELTWLRQERGTRGESEYSLWKSQHLQGNFKMVGFDQEDLRPKGIPYRWKHLQTHQQRSGSLRRQRRKWRKLV